jgi:hypothetical protein
VNLSLVDELRGEDPAIANEFAVTKMFFVEQVEAVAFARVHDEVDDTAEDARQIQGEAVGNIAALRREE